MTSGQDGVAGSGNPYVAVYAHRLAVQGAGHPGTVATLLNVLGHGLSHSVGQDATAPNPPVPSELPPGAGPEGVRLEGDHVDLLAETLERAVELQGEETASYGPDHPRALLATCLLAHALAAADQLDGQLEAAQVLIDDAHDGLVELAMSPGAVAPDAVRIAEALHQWIHGRIEDGDDESDE
ncbi:hypothetical protein ACIRQQ_43485 [Streptomyces fuscichromogenes]|uniref:hypothetical protein n=1 Tax=Streptomyces fuscichromogenes TaxID=1324013 RepID=UPI00381F00A0